MGQDDMRQYYEGVVLMQREPEPKRCPHPIESAEHDLHVCTWRLSEGVVGAKVKCFCGATGPNGWGKNGEEATALAIAAWNHRTQCGGPVLEDGHLFAGLDTDQQAKLFVVVGDEPKPITHSQWCKVLNALGIESGGMPIAILHKWLSMPPKPED